MTPEQQRIAIAEACGWTWKQGSHADFLWHDPQDKSHSSFCKERSPLGCIADLPDYLNSLDTMHEAEKSMTDEQFNSFQIELSRVVFKHPCAVTYPVGFKCRDFWNATAAQRAEAFLRTLNLWKD